MIYNEFRGGTLLTSVAWLEQQRVAPGITAERDIFYTRFVCHTSDFSPVSADDDRQVDLIEAVRRRGRYQRIETALRQQRFQRQLIGFGHSCAGRRQIDRRVRITIIIPRI